MRDELDAYIKSGYKKVDGWAIPLAMHAIVEINRIQREQSISGPVCEIGVHHGRLFILLHMLTQNDEISAAWDLFDLQDENVDDSGRGDLRQFEANLRSFGCDLNRIKIETKNSLNLGAKDVIETCGGRPRFFSIDGGHTAEITYHDLSTAAGSICEGGVIILDDFFNEAWPGVAEGASRFLNEQSSLYPFAILGNKVMLTNSSDVADEYRNAFSLAEPGAIEKRSHFFGSEVICMIPINSNAVWKYIRETALGKMLKQLRSVFRK